MLYVTRSCLNWALKRGSSLPKFRQKVCTLIFRHFHSLQVRWTFTIYHTSGGYCSAQIGAANRFVFQSSPAISASSFTLNSQRNTLGLDAFRASSRAKSDSEDRGGFLRGRASGNSNFEIYHCPNKFALHIKNCNNKKPPFWFLIKSNRVVK